MMILENLSPDDRYCAGNATTILHRLNPPIEKLYGNYITDQEKSKLAEQLKRKWCDSYMCSGCMTRLPENLFEPEEKSKDDRHRRCIGHTGALVLFKDIYITWPCIQMARRTQNDYMQFFGCPNWAKGGEHIEDIYGDGGPSRHRSENMESYIEASIESLPNSDDVSIAMIASLIPPWLENFLDDCNNGDSEYLRESWNRNISYWNVHLCEHVDLCSDNMFRWTLSVAELWLQTDWEEMPSFETGSKNVVLLERGCVDCDTLITVRIRRKTDLRMMIDFRGTRKMKLTRATDKQWLDCISQRDGVSKKLKKLGKGWPSRIWDKEDRITF